MCPNVASSARQLPGNVTRLARTSIWYRTLRIGVQLELSSMALPPEAVVLTVKVRSSAMRSK